MRILFALQHPGYLRHYEPVVRLLAQQQHHVQFVFSQMKLMDAPEGVIPKRLVEEFPEYVSYRPAPVRRDKWYPIARILRGGIDYVRYLKPQYKDAPSLSGRAGAKTSPVYDKIFRYLPFLKLAIFVRLLLKLGHKAENAIPSNRDFDDAIEEFRPDAVIVTPLINFASSQVDFIKSARNLNIASALMVASWDNLTNKGLIRLQPDSVVVWNEHQMLEAAEMHGTRVGDVVVTGAQSYDRWFEMRAEESDSTFCERVGLTDQSSYILYLCSSPFIGGDREVPFVRKWIERVRNSEDPDLAAKPILIRPHPQNAKVWKEFDETRYSNVVVYPKAGDNPITKDARHDFFSSMYHSSCVVGINTSGMIEAGIVGKPVLTLLADGFEDTQTGTLHFHHLVELGLVTLAPDMDAHIDELSLAISPSDEWLKSNREFIKSFVRPLGLDVPAAPVVAEAVLNLKFKPELSRRPSMILRGVLSVLITPASYLFQVRKKKKKQKQQTVREKTFKEKLLAVPKAIMGILLLPFVIARRLMFGASSAIKLPFMSKAGRSKMFKRMTVRLFKRVWVMAAWLLGKLGLKGIAKEVFIPKLIAASEVEIECISAYSGAATESIPAEKAVVELPLGKRISREIGAAQKKGDWVVIGPWLSEVGFEVLYWVPFLKKAFGRKPWDPAKTIVISRGGAAAWYTGLADHYLDIFDVMSVSEYRGKMEARWEEVGGQKQCFVDELDHELMDFAVKKFGMNSYGNIHPHIMYNGFRDFWRGRMGIGTALKHFDMSFFDKPPAPVEGLPDDYYAVKFYFRPSFLDNEKDRAFVNSVITHLTQKHDVVLLNTGMEIDDHPELFPEENERLHRVDNMMEPASNLAVQTAIIANAKGFVGTYGGLSYLPLFYGVTSFAFYSNEEHFLPSHLELAKRVSRENETSFFAMSVDEVDLLSQVLTVDALPGSIVVSGMIGSDEELMPAKSSAA